MPLEKTGIALRSTVFAPNEIVKLVKPIDQSGVSHVFLPDIRTGFDSIELSAASLGVSKGLQVGPGVIRLNEHPPDHLARRLETLQALSENRFLLGIGTGDPGPDPKKKVADMLNELQNLKEQFPSRGAANFPKVFIATLKQGIAKRVAPYCSGVLLNFCSAAYAGSLVQSVKQSFKGNLGFACYLKVFFSKSQPTAQRMMLQEFMMYNSIPQYNKMFELDGTAGEIDKAGSGASSKEFAVPAKLLEISPVNPEGEALSEYVAKYRSAGIDIPCIYPYFSKEDAFDFKLATIQMILSALMR